jgi:hypothetical protein
MKGKKKSMLCFIPMLQCESFSHLQNCYFCLNKNFIVFEEEQIKTEYYTIPYELKLVSYAETFLSLYHQLTGRNFLFLKRKKTVLKICQYHLIQVTFCSVLKRYLFERSELYDPVCDISVSCNNQKLRDQHKRICCVKMGGLACLERDIRNYQHFMICRIPIVCA